MQYSARSVSHVHIGSARQRDACGGGVDSIRQGDVDTCGEYIRLPWAGGWRHTGNATYVEKHRHTQK